MIASVQWQNLWTAAGGLAGALGIIYAVGASIEALRLHHEGLPVEQAISVVPRTAMASLAVDALLLPAILTAIFSTAAVVWVQRFTEREADVAKLKQKLAQKEARAERRKERIRNAGWVHRAMRSVLTPIFSRVLGPVWAATFGRLPTLVQGWAFVGIVYVLFIPWAPTGLVTFVVMPLQLWLIGHIARHRVLRIISRRREAVLIGVVAGLTISAQTMAREVIHPGPLPRASVKIVGQKTETRGDYVATTPEGVYLGVRRRLILIPDRLVDNTAIWSAPVQKQEESRTLLSRVE